MTEQKRRRGPHLGLPETRIQRQQCPADFAATLTGMRARKDPRLPAVIRMAHEEGWTFDALGTAMGISNARARQIGAAAEGTVWGVDIPAPPRRPVGRSQPRPTLTADEVAELRLMQQVARTVNGSTRSDDPRRRTCEKLASLLHQYHVRRGVSVYHLAQLIGVTTNAVRSRLARHGYLQPLPSQAEQSYRGRFAGETGGGCGG